MKVEIQTIAFTNKQELKNFVYEKVNAPIRFYNQVFSSEIFLRLDNSHTKENKVCQIKLVISGYDLWARSRSEIFEQATLKIVKALKKQIENLKTKLISKRKNITEIKYFDNE